MKNELVVLVTGCSGGIGREICEVLSKRGYIVAATARNKEQLNDLSAALKLALDVTQEASVQNAVKQVIKEFGKIDILVNNAGYSIRGAMEEVNDREMRKMFDVNVFGSIAMIRAILPGMRERRIGKIIQIGSVSGRFSQSVNGVYCASKYAVEALSDALRLELNDFGIQSTVIEPGAMQTGFFQNMENASKTIMENPASPYRKQYQRDINYRRKQKRMDPGKAAGQICDIIEKKKLRPRYMAAAPLAFRVLLLLPDRLKEMIIRRQY